MVNYRRESDAVFSGINIVPFTDIVLVLLIIFMIAAPGLVNRGINVSLPGSSTSKSQRPSKVNILLTSGGKIYLDSKELSLDALRIRMRELVARNNEASVVLNADEGAKHGSVIEALDAIRGAGAKNIYVGTSKK